MNGNVPDEALWRRLEDRLRTLLADPLAIR